MSKNLKRKNIDIYSESRKRFMGSLARLDENTIEIPRPAQRSKSSYLIKTEKPSKIVDSIVRGKCSLTPIVNVSRQQKLLKTSQCILKESKGIDSNPQEDLAGIFQKISKIPDAKIRIVDPAVDINLSKELEKNFDESFKLSSIDIKEKEMPNSPGTEISLETECCTPIASIKVPKTCKRQKKIKHKSKVEEELKQKHHKVINKKIGK
ncbi:unnamed protein product [Blepharisma stoltei]|uniref:Uncharacterized protein n=1 Tax=Blepharisma stoltei TaxID=1481888 RepID=A0AAU9JFF2_9CILI|nr:unnamed protein product [Blepharisma stoltei]